MSQKSRRARQTLPRRQPPWLWLLTGGALLLIVAGLWVWWGSAGASPVKSESGGAPRLTVDQTAIDEGYVQFNVPVRSTFRLSNTGTQPLRILGEPQVELVQGC